MSSNKDGLVLPALMTILGFTGFLINADGLDGHYEIFKGLIPDGSIPTVEKAFMDGAVTAAVTIGGLFTFVEHWNRRNR